MTRTKKYTTFEIADLLGVYPTTVADWIDQGKLKGFTTPGGHRRVNGEDLRVFLHAYDMPAPPEVAVEQKKRILVVDDDEQIRNIIARVFEEDNEFEVLTAEDGFEAGQIVGSVSITAMVLDIMLPGIDGFKICRMVKETYPRMKVIAITGYDSEANRTRILEAGADDFLAKPFELGTLQKHLHQLLELPATV